MASLHRTRASGFSLVELLVAVLFVGFLMAGMANVFKSSVNVLSTSSEGLSSARRNRMSIDLLYDDLNTAGMFLADITSPPTLSDSNPVFYIIPNVTITGAAADDPATADQVYFYLDDPLPFEGTLIRTGGGAAGDSSAPSSSESVAKTYKDQTYKFTTNSSDKQIVIDCHDASYAAMVKSGQGIILKDAFENYFISGTPAVSGTTVTITTGPDPMAGIVGHGDAGLPHPDKPLTNCDVVFYRPSQMVRYSVKMKLFDPQKSTGVPCLVRDQGTYSLGGFVADPTLESIVAENISGFKVYMSADSGQTWAGYGKTYTGFANGWTAGIRAELDTQLATAGRAGFTSTAGVDTWIRSIPTLMRLDVTTRTAVKRAEDSATPLTATAYKDFTQSMVLVPRHFGLPLGQ